MTLYESYQIKFCGHTELAMNIAKCDENCSFFVKDSRHVGGKKHTGKNCPHVPPPLWRKNCHLLCKMPSFLQFFGFLAKFLLPPPWGRCPTSTIQGRGASSHPMKICWQENPSWSVLLWYSMTDTQDNYIIGALDVVNEKSFVPKVPQSGQLIRNN